MDDFNLAIKHDRLAKEYGFEPATQERRQREYSELVTAMRSWLGPRKSYWNIFLSQEEIDAAWLEELGHRSRLARERQIIAKNDRLSKILLRPSSGNGRLLIPAKPSPLTRFLRAIK